MIKSIYIDNFKALNNFKIDLKPLTVLIGANGTGKSTILQAIDLVCKFVNMDIHTYIGERKWTINDLKSHLNPKRHMTFRMIIELPVNGEPETIEWEIVLHPVKEKERAELIKEKIRSITRDTILLMMDSSGFERYNWEKNAMEQYPPLSLTVSLLNTVDIEKDSKRFPSLAVLKKFALDIDSFELLSTEKMRKSYRGKAESMGIGGEKLAGFIHGLSAEKKENLKTRLKNYIPFIDGIDTRVKGSSRWIELSIDEIFAGAGKPMKIKSVHSSDGILRMVAISALAEIEKDNGVILLDEIEDGISPYLAAGLVTDLKKLTEQKQRQVVVTTNNSVILDYFPAESVVFLWREGDGTVRCGNMFENEEIKESLEYMYPGEVWINMKEEEIVEKLRSRSKN
jgi:predicted ATPase